MKTALALVLASAVALSGCAMTGLTRNASAADTTAMIKALSEHVQSCDRQYQGSLGVGASFTFAIDCRATQVYSPAQVGQIPQASSPLPPPF